MVACHSPREVSCEGVFETSVSFLKTEVSPCRVERGILLNKSFLFQLMQELRSFVIVGQKCEDWYKLCSIIGIVCYMHQLFCV